jgi:hypothetical protein
MVPMQPPRYYGILRGDLRIVKLLVSHGAWVGGPDGQSSAMVLYAVLKGDISVLTYLLEESAPVSAACFDPLDRQRVRRTTPLLLAVEKGNVAAVRILLDHGADVHGSGNSTGLNPLCTAVDRRHPEVIKLLLKYEARINDRESTAPWASGVAAIHVASYRGYDEILGILLAAGADVSVTCQRGGATGVTALHLAGSSACVGKLMENGAKPHTGDSNRQYPLSGAVQVGDVGAVRELVKRGAPVNAQDRRHETALHITSRLFARDAKAGNTEKLAVGGRRERGTQGGRSPYHSHGMCQDAAGEGVVEEGGEGREAGTLGAHGRHHRACNAKHCGRKRSAVEPGSEDVPRDDRGVGSLADCPEKGWWFWRLLGGGKGKGKNGETAP